MEFQLYRLKIQWPAQTSILHTEREEIPELIKKMIKEKPSRELRKGYTWHIGNTIPLDRNGFFFALGRVTKSIQERYDAEKGNFFLDEDNSEAPFTFVFVDTRLGIFAIAKKPKIGPTVSAIANNLKSLLSISDTAFSRSLSLVLNPINDPEKFIDIIADAYAVERFCFTFNKPNPLDAHEDLIIPLQKATAEVNGTGGKTEFKGDALDPQAIAAIAQSVAATGDDATARIKPGPRSKSKLIRLKNNPVLMTEKSLATTEEKVGFLAKMRAKYGEIRNTHQTE